MSVETRPSGSRKPSFHWPLGDSLHAKVLFAVVLGLVAYLAWREREAGVEQAPQEPPVATRTTDAPSSAPNASGNEKTGEANESAANRPPPSRDPRESKDNRNYVVDHVTIRDLNGRIVYRGAVDLKPTIDRIKSGRRLNFPRDGTTFQNRERRLPLKPSGYYQEWVHPTPRLDGPGPQRVVTGTSGEIYYTSDHYASFHRIE